MLVVVPKQDGHFFWRTAGRLLPPLSLIAEFNAGRCCIGGALPTGFSHAELMGEPHLAGPDHDCAECL